MYTHEYNYIYTHTRTFLMLHFYKGFEDLTKITKPKMQ